VSVTNLIKRVLGDQFNFVGLTDLEDALGRFFDIVLLDTSHYNFTLPDLLFPTNP